MLDSIAQEVLCSSASPSPRRRTISGPWEIVGLAPLFSVLSLHPGSHFTLTWDGIVSPLHVSSPPAEPTPPPSGVSLAPGTQLVVGGVIYLSLSLVKLSLVHICLEGTDLWRER